MNVREFKTRYAGPGIKDYVSKREETPQWINETKIVGELLSRFPSKSVVDVPVGTGRFMQFYAKNQNKVIGLDVSPDMLEQARAEAKRHNVKAPRIELADIFELDPARYSADVAVCLRFLNHLESDWVPKALKSLAAMASEAVIASIRTVDPDNLTDEQRDVHERQESQKKKARDRRKNIMHVHLKADFDRWIDELGLAVAESHNVLVTKAGGILNIYVLKPREALSALPQLDDDPSTLRTDLSPLQAVSGSFPRSFLVAAEIAIGRPLTGELAVTARQIKQGNGSYTERVTRYTAAAPNAERSVVSLIAKTLVAPTLAGARHGPAWQGWNREAYVYTDTAFCEGADGIRFPRCYLIETISEQKLRLFLEDIGGLDRARGLDDYVSICKALGRFGGAAHVKQSWQRPWLADTEAPLVPPDNYARLLEGIKILIPSETPAENLAKDFGLLLNDLDIARRLAARVPATVVHGDAHQGNCFMREGGSEIIFLDLAKVARGRVGHDLATFVAPLGRLIRHQISFAEYEELAAAMRNAYVAGLAAGGLVVDSEIFSDYYELQLAMNCARIMSRPRMVESWMAAPHIDQDADKSRKAELARFFVSLRKNIHVLARNWAT